MDLCGFPYVPLTKILRFLDPSSISNILQTNRFLHKTVIDHRRRLPKRRGNISISLQEAVYPMYLISINDKEINNYCLSVPNDQDLPIRNWNYVNLHFTSVESMHEEIGNIFSKFLARRDLNFFSANDLCEEVLEKIRISLESNRTCVRNLIFINTDRVSPSDVCQFVRSMSAFEDIFFNIHHESYSCELFKIPQVCSATKSLDVRDFTPIVHPAHLSLTDSDILSFSAKTIRFRCGWDYSRKFVRKFVQEFLSHKRSIGTGAIRDLSEVTYNFFQMDTTDLDPTQIFDGMRYELSPQMRRSGFITRDDGEILELVFDDNSSKFCYCLKKSIEG